MGIYVLNIPVEWQGLRWQAFADMKRKKQAGEGGSEKEREKETEQRDIPRPELED